MKGKIVMLTGLSFIFILIYVYKVKPQYIKIMTIAFLTYVAICGIITLTTIICALVSLF